MIQTISPSPSPSAHRILDRARVQTKDDIQPWTAARCHRLLRQLQCRLGALRKLVHEARQPSAKNSTKRAGSDNNALSRPSKRTRYTYAQRRSTSSNTTKTNATLTTPPRSVRTFGTMNLGRCSPATGRVDFSTPMFRKICSQPAASGCPPKKSETPSPTAASLISKLQSLRRLAPEGHYRIYETIFGWLSGLLRSTEAKLPVPHPKSLLGMCLRRVPAALAEIEAWDRQVAEENGTQSAWDSSNASVELYGQLESFGSAGLGWKPMRLVVRAHALSMLVEAVSDGLFEPEFVSLLAELYLSFMCGQDATAIVAGIPSQVAKPRSSLNTLDSISSLQPVAAIVGGLQGKGKPRAGFDCLSSLIKSGKLPLEWLYTKGFQGVWAATLEALSTERPEPSAIEFTCTVVEQLSLNAGVKEDSKSNTKKQALVNVVAGLTATGIAFGGSYGPARSEVARRLMYSLDRCIHHLQSEGKTVGGGSLLALATARYLVMAESTYVSSTIRQQAEEVCRQLLLGHHGISSQAQYREALFLVSSTAQCQGRACGIACHDALSWICTMLERLGLPDWFRGGLRIDGAFLLAQKTNDLRDLAFAEKLPAADRHSIGTNTVFSGWRWEEGISEWVFLSPGSKTRNGADRLLRIDETPIRRERERGRASIKERLEGNGRRSRSGMSGVSNSYQDEDDNGDSESENQGHEQGQGQDDSGDELGGDWEEGLTGICGLAVGNAARTSIVSSDGDPRWRNPARKNSNMSRARRSVGMKNRDESTRAEAMSPTTTMTTTKMGSRKEGLVSGRICNGEEEESLLLPLSRYDASQPKTKRTLSLLSSSSESGLRSQVRSQPPFQSQSWSQALGIADVDVRVNARANAEACGRGPRPSKGTKRAGTQTQARTRGMLLRGMSQGLGGNGEGGDDDWDELI